MFLCSKIFYSCILYDSLQLHIRTIVVRRVVLMNKVNREAIKQLLETEDSATISMYMPAHQFPTSEHITEDKIRFKNLIKSAKETLKDKGIDEGLGAQMIHQLEAVLDDDAFWQHVTSGMAFFCSPAGLRYFHLPIECDEHVSVGERYDVAPLLVIASQDTTFYMLALATKHPVLFKGDMYSVSKESIELPESIEKALNIDELHSNSQTMRAGGYGAGNPGAKSHGQGDSRQAGQEERLKYFRLIDDKLQSSKDIDPKIPVLLAGAEEEVSAYKHISKIKKLLKTSLNGNLTDEACHAIHALAWPAIQKELCGPDVARELEKVHSLVGTGLASTENQDILKAATEGRTETLLVGMLMETKDSVRDSNEAITKLTFSEHYAVDKVAKVARAVFDQGGRVIGILRGEMPNGAHEAAIYRY